MIRAMEEAARHYNEGDFAAAAQACLDIVAAEPRHFDALHLLGVVLQRLGKTADSVAILTRALRLRPDDARALHNIAVAWLHLGLYGDARAAALRAAQYDGTNPDLLNTLALALLGLGRAEDAAHLLRQVVAHFPEHAPSRCTLGQACVELGLLDAAALQFEALLTEPLDASRATDIANSLSDIRLEQGAPAVALALLRTVRTRWPDARTDWNESLALLTLGQYAEGWAKYEARWTEPLHDPLPRGAGALDLDRVAGRHVLVLAEQGRGDILQFVRYAPLLAAHGARVALSVPEDLTALLRCVSGVESVVGPLDTEPLVDAIAPMMSLPLAFGAELDTVPAAIPYLFAPPDRVAIWRSRLGPPGAPRIGAMWMGSAHSQARSSMPLSR